ncbi:hypothetical protein K438DRAFT_1934584 [Mycena galopus ATCC 62051]|nr:hypothetical protein K438DRAFT_1934584 [Mycena galopus ATCC 62051]
MATETSQKLQDPLPVRNGTPINIEDEDNNSSNFTEEETNYVLNQLLENPVKCIFELYEFVRGKSGVGWDDGEKRASAETEYIDRFVEATCANMQHLKKSRAKKSSTTSSASTTALSSTNATCKRACEPLLALENDLSAPALDNPTSQTAATPSSPKPYNDELLPPPTNDEDENDDKPTKPNRHDRSISGGSPSGGHCTSRTTEAGNQIARGLKSIGEGMSEPLVTKADTSHVDDIISVFTEDATLLPDDPNSEYYALFVDALSSNQNRTHAFVKSTIRTQRIALLKLILKDNEVAVPDQWV